MKTVIKNNGIKDYTSLEAEKNKFLIEIGSMKSFGASIALGNYSYDLKTGEKLATPKKLEAGNIMEVWNYDDVTDKNNSEYNSNQVFTAGDYILSRGTIYRAILTHWAYQITPDNFNTFYQQVANLDDLLAGQVPDWIQPTGAQNAYKKGEKVTYKGKVYQSTIDANVWAPDVYPAGWSVV